MSGVNCHWLHTEIQPDRDCPGPGACCCLLGFCLVAFRIANLSAVPEVTSTSPMLLRSPVARGGRFSYGTPHGASIACVTGDTRIGTGYLALARMASSAARGRSVCALDRRRPR